ncbi:MAG: hypothetical protein KGJ13_10525 [Patescibacteria group bacterium]|nr:hypothetical protein [Patescibacteria group bacterium]
MGLLSRHKREKAKAEAFYQSIGKVPCPYFGKDIIFNSDGFHHLQFSAERERPKQEQMLKFSLLPAVPHIIRNAGTIQEYRHTMEPIGRKRFSDGAREMREIEYWGIVAITKGEKPIRIKIILRRVGNGNIIFWSVMPTVKLKDGDSYLHLASSRISEE